MAKPMTKVTIITRREKFDELRKSMARIDVTGITLTQVEGFGVQRGIKKAIEGVIKRAYTNPKIKVDIVVCEVPVEEVIRVALETLHTGDIGDGKIFTAPISQAVRIRTGERDDAAL
jgi:nitrogen regulatory protein PII